jgi:hypothetical protein
MRRQKFSKNVNDFQAKTQKMPETPATFRVLQIPANLRPKKFSFYQFPEIFHPKPRKYSILQGNKGK